MRKRLRKKMAKHLREIDEWYASAPASFWVNAQHLAHDRFFEALVRSGCINTNMTPLWAQWLEEIDMTLKPVIVQKGVSVGFTTAAITGGKLKYFAAGDTPVGLDDELNVVAMDEVGDE